MSNPAAPALIAVLQAVQQFVTNVGVDPAQIPLKFPGALAVLMGQIELQIPALATAELSQVQNTINSKIADLIKSLQSQ